jgi:O-antigen/teichoic acid export membrane protein
LENDLETAGVENGVFEPPARSLKTNFGATLTGNTVFALSQFSILVILAKFSSAEALGSYMLGLAIAGPVYKFSNLQLRSLQATDAANAFPFADYLGLRIITVAASIAIVAIVSASTFAIATAMVIVAVTLTKAVDGMSDLYYGLVQKHERMDCVARSLVARGILGAGAIASVTYLTGSVFWGLVALAAVWAAVFVGYDVRAEKSLDFSPAWRRDAVISLVLQGLPLGLVMVILSVDFNIPVYFVQHYYGAKDVGVLGAITQLSLAGMLVVTAMGQAASPRLAKLYAAGDARGYRRLILRLLGLAALVGAAGLVVAMLAGRELLAIIYRPEYAEYSGAFVVLVLGAAFWYLASILAYGATVRRRLFWQAMMGASAGVAAVVACWTLVPRHGIMGAAVAAAISAAVCAAGNAAVLLWKNSGTEL